MSETSRLEQLFQSLSNSLDHPLIGGLVLFIAALMCMLIIGNPMIAWLKNKRWKKDATGEETWAVREDTPDTHLVKTGTPSMGGMGIIASTLLACAAVVSFIIFVPDILAGKPLSWNLNLFDTIALILLPVYFLSHGLLGFADDWSKASGRGGLSARAKLLGQVVLSCLFLWLAAYLVSGKFVVVNPPETTNYADHIYSSGIAFIFLLLALIATCNAVNLTDGIDGLAAGLAVQCGLILFIISKGPDAPPFTSEFFALALAGASLGFLNFNKYKARVFMGDTGSLAIGAALGAGAILQHAVFLLPFIGFIYFAEMLSVTLQVLWFKYTRKKYGEGRRLFRRAPLHHHFELGGWSEWRVVGTFWLVNLLTSAIGLLLWHQGIIPRWP